MSEPRQRDGSIYGSAAAMGGDVLGFALAPFLEQQERGVGDAHRHALVRNHGDRIDHRAADRQGFH